MIVKPLVLIVTILLQWSSFLIAAPPAVGAPAAASAHPHTIAVIPFYAPEKIWALYTPFINYLTKTTGTVWQLKLYHNHDSLIEGICGNEVTLALVGPVPLGRAFKKCGVRPVLTALSKNGEPSYRSVIVTADSSIRSLRDLKEKTFGIFRGSTAAHIIPLGMLKKAGIALPTLKISLYSNQDSIMNAVMKREISAAGMKESLVLKFPDAALRRLAASDPLPNFTFCASPGAREETIRAFTAVLLKIQPLERNRDAALTSDWDDEVKNGFVRPTESFIRTVLKLYDLHEEITHEIPL